MLSEKSWGVGEEKRNIKKGDLSNYYFIFFGK